MGNLYLSLCVHTPMVEPDRKYIPLKAKSSSRNQRLQETSLINPTRFETNLYQYYYQYDGT
jgi:hypothetical protein